MTITSFQIGLSSQHQKTKRNVEHENLHVWGNSSGRATRQAGHSQTADGQADIHSNSTAAELSEKKFNFNIDTNGHEEQISLLNLNSGFLVIDKNDNSTINDGRELFSPNWAAALPNLVTADGSRATLQPNNYNLIFPHYLGLH